MGLAVGNWSWAEVGLQLPFLFQVSSAARSSEVLGAVFISSHRDQYETRTAQLICTCAVH